MSPTHRIFLPEICNIVRRKPLCSCDSAYHMVYGLLTCGWLNQSLCRLGTRNVRILNVEFWKRNVSKTVCTSHEGREDTVEDCSPHTPNSQGRHSGGSGGSAPPHRVHPPQRGTVHPTHWVASFTEETLAPDPVDWSNRSMAPMPSQWLQRVLSPQHTVIRTPWSGGSAPPYLVDPPQRGTRSQFKNNYFAKICTGSEMGSYLRLVDGCITQL